MNALGSVDPLKHIVASISNVGGSVRRCEHRRRARFYERGAGVTLSSGTGSTGAAIAAILRKLCASPVEIQTAGEPLQLRWDDSVYLTGPAEIVGTGEFYG